MAMLLAVVVLEVMLYYRKSKAFGFGTKMTVLLFFLPIVGNLVIGLGNSKFSAPQAPTAMKVGPAIV